MTGPLPDGSATSRRWLRRAAAAIVAVAAGVQLGFMIIFWQVMSRELHMNDFGKFYYSAQAQLDGGDMYGPTIATAVPVGTNVTREFWNMNPPHFHLLVLPLALLTPSAALGLWFAISFYCLVFSILLIAGELSIRWTPRNAFIATVAVLLPSSTGMVVLTGQVTFILMLPVTLAWIAARRGAWTRAGIYLGLAASVKPFLGIFWIYFLMRRQFRAARVMAGVALLSVILGLAVFGADSYRSWVAVVSSVDWVWGPMNGSLAALFARTFGPSPTFRPLIDAPEAGWIATWIVSAGVAACAFWRFGRFRSNGGEDWAFAGFILTALLISPLGWIYYIALLGGPAVSLWLGWRLRPARLTRGCIALAIPGLLLPHLITGAWAHLPWGGVTLGSIYTWACIGLWTAVVIDASIPTHVQAVGDTTTARLR